MPYLGNEPGAITDAFTDTFSGNGSNTGFTLTRASTTNSVFVRIHGVMQRNGTDFTVDGTTLTFTTAPPNASNNVVVQFFTVGSIQTVADNAITLAKMAGGTDGNLITFDASGDPAYVATGSSGQVLTSAGAGSPPTFETIASPAIAQTAFTQNVSDISTTSTSFTSTGITIVLSSNLASTNSKVRLRFHGRVDADASRIISFTLHDGSSELTPTDTVAMTQWATAPDNGYRGTMQFEFVDDTISSTTPKTYTLQFKTNAGTINLGSEADGSNNTPTYLTAEEIVA